MTFPTVTQFQDCPSTRLAPRLAAPHEHFPTRAGTPHSGFHGPASSLWLEALSLLAAQVDLLPCRPGKASPMEKHPLLHFAHGPIIHRGCTAPLGAWLLIQGCAQVDLHSMGLALLLVYPLGPMGSRVLQWGQLVVWLWSLSTLLFFSGKAGVGCVCVTLALGSQ